MMIRKGPFGHYAIEQLVPGTGITGYAIEIIDSGILSSFLPVYINKTCDGTELAFDYSGLTSVNDFVPRKDRRYDASLSARRTAVGELFLSFIDSMDMLVNPSLITLDKRFVFTDDEGRKIRLCLAPTETDRPNRLSSIDQENMERLLSEDFFREVLSEDEITALIYSIGNNDEELFTDTANKIIRSPLEKDSIRTRFSTGKTSSTLILSLLSALLSSISFFLSFGSTLTYIIFITALSLLVMFVYRNFSDIKAVVRPVKSSSSDSRSQILFEDPGDNMLNCAYLESVHPVNGSILRYAVYQDLTTIGSDRFLSDFFVEDRSISPIHAQIYLTSDTVYLSDCSQDGKTYIDDKSLQPETKYEIKNGQKLTFGGIDFRLKIT